MNGRVYDPVTARFLSADPTIQFPDNLQSYNRYSYVLNNPLAFTDPSGYGLFKTIGRLWHNQYVRTALAITAAAVTGQVWMAQFGSSFAFANSIAGGFVGGLVQTGNLNGAVHGAFSAGLFYGAGQINQGIDSSVGRGVTKALAGCISAQSSGGKCGREEILTSAIDIAREGLSTWQTTNWGVNNPESLTREMLDKRIINFDQMALKVTSEAVLRGASYSVSGKDFRAGFLSALPSSLSSEIYRAYVPWDAQLLGSGGAGGEKDENGTIVYRDLNNFGRWIGKTQFSTEGQAFSRFMDGGIPGMDAISKLHDVWAISYKNSICESDACFLTMLPAAGISFGALSKGY